MVITRDELEELDPKKTRAIEIKDFVDLDEIDPIYFDHPYYLGLDKGAEKAYALLVKAMEDARKVAIARFVLRSKENLAALRPMDGVMTMATMRFADEVVSPDEISDELDFADGEPTKKELEMAKALIDLTRRRLRRLPVPRRVPRRGPGPDRAQGEGREGDRGRLRGALADEGARPDGGARGIAGGGQGRGGEERRARLEARSKSAKSRSTSKSSRSRSKAGRQVEVDGREIALTNLDKVLWPARRGGAAARSPRSPRARRSTTTPGSPTRSCPTCAAAR